MIIEYERLVELLEASGLPDAGAPARMALMIRFTKKNGAKHGEQFIADDGTILTIDLDENEDLCSIEIV